MNYWRMQLHPDDSEFAAVYTINSLANGFIGLDFAQDPGDLEKNNPDSLERKTNNIFGFVYEITTNDIIAIYLHNQPFAIVEEIEEYNYIKKPIAEVNIWFRHFRKFKSVSYYSDVYGRIKEEHKSLIMTNTFSRVSTDSETGKLIQDWKGKI
jgi:hypothetical protein